jgi:hypothetical protein
VSIEATLSFKDLTEIGIVIVALVILLVIPFYAITLINGIPMTDAVDPTYVNGLITASGLFLAFILSAAISRSEALEPAIGQLFEGTSGANISLIRDIIIAIEVKALTSYMWYLEHKHYFLGYHAKNSKY